MRRVTVDTQQKLLEWTKRIQALAQSGLAYGKDEFDIERYEELREISVDMMELMSGQERVDIKSWFANETGYATPKVGARAVIFRDEKMLFVREKADGKWCLPGGWSDIGQTPSGSVIKEVREETGYEVEVKRMLALFDRKCHNQLPSAFDIYTFYFECDIIGGEPSESIEIEEIGFFGVDELPPISLDRMTPEQIRLLFTYMNNPSLTPYFD
ncbi:NUDIX hydrolase [Bacillus horti]